MDGTVHIVSLDQRPCVVHYLDRYNKFLVGTYELFPTIEEARCKLNYRYEDEQLRRELDKINQRAGKLILLRGNDVSVPNIEYEFECELGGGVFDTKVKYCRTDNSYSVFVAHSNGSVGIYKLALHCGTKICLKEYIKVSGAKMLTSIDLFRSDTGESSPEESNGPTANSNPNAPNFSNTSSTGSLGRLIHNTSDQRNKLVVGESEGFVTVISGSKQLRTQVASGDSIWQVKTIKLSSHQNIVIVGSENSSWYILGLGRNEETLDILYKNSFKDFGAGVTSITTLSISHFSEYDLVEILLGSYDETLQIYHVKLKHDGLSKPDVCHKDTLSIAEGGIWRVKHHRGKSRRQLCVAAMYAGTYLLNLDQPENPMTKLIETECLKLAHKPLHYDLDVSTYGTTYCIVDFNNSMCLFKTVSDQ